MTRSIVRVGVVLALALLIGGVAAAQPPGRQDVPLVVTFADHWTTKTTCAAGPGWCGDGNAYMSDLLEKYLVAEITFYDFGENGVGGGFRFYFTSTSGRGVAFHFGTPLPAAATGAWCPEVCPGTPKDRLPNFALDPIKSVSVRSAFGYDPPNYDFFSPDICDHNADGRSDWVNGACVTGLVVSFQTAKKDYRLRFSPNLWRSLATPITSPGGAGTVRYQAPNQWTLEPLLSYDFGGDIGPRAELCPVSFERKDTSKGWTTWTFLGCYNMPFELTLTKR